MINILVTNHRLLAASIFTARPLWEYGIRKEIKRGNTVLVVAHTNTLRGLMQVVDSELLNMCRVLL